jgi:peptidoglycan/xylan/chitin deacetylase (PgdA/CDA1 family)
MAGYRSEVISAVKTIAWHVPLSILLKATHQDLILPVYHLVSDQEVPHIKHLYEVKNISAFVQDLEFLIENFQPLDFRALVNHISGEKKLTSPGFFLTFDDGLREFYTIIAPILESKGVPAMNFLNTAFIDNRDLFYRYKISLIIDKIKTGQTGEELKSISEILRLKYINQTRVIKQLLQLGYSDIPVIDSIAKILEINFSAYLDTYQPYLNSDEITDLIRRGFTFGSHSIDHPFYHDLDLSEQIRQTRLSMDTIVETFRLNYRAFAFPFTDYQISKTFFDYLYKDEKKPDLSFGSAGLKQDLYQQHLQRIPMEMDPMSASQIIHAELLYYFLKGFFGKNQIIRS